MSVKPPGSFWFPHLCRKPEINVSLLAPRQKTIAASARRSLNGRFVTPGEPRRCHVCDLLTARGDEKLCARLWCQQAEASLYINVKIGCFCRSAPHPPHHHHRLGLVRGIYGAGGCFRYPGGFLNVSRARWLAELKLQHFYGLDLLCENCSADVSLFL